jgi:hypothetical protein
MSSVDVTLPIDHILNANPVWIRDELGDLGPLAKSLKKEGQRQPILLDHTYRVIDGARRVEAARMIGWTTIYVVVARNFFVMSDLLVAAQGTPLQLPHDIFAKMELLAILRDAYSPHVRAMSARTRGQSHSKELVERAAGSGVDIPHALGLTPSATEELGRVRRFYLLPDHTPEVRQQLREAMYPLRFEIFTLLEAMRDALQIKPLVTNRKVLADQRALFPRALAGIRGGILALPEPRLLDPGHSPEDLALWLNEINKIHKDIFLIRKQIKLMLNDDQGDQS